jgi:hypothetical protein
MDVCTCRTKAHRSEKTGRHAPQQRVQHLAAGDGIDAFGCVRTLKPWDETPFRAFSSHLHGICKLAANRCTKLCAESETASGPHQQGENSVNGLKYTSSARVSKSTLASVLAALALLAGTGAKAQVTSADIVDGQVKAPDISSAAVTAAKIAAGAVTNVKLADNSVTGAKVQNGSLTGADIQDGSITEVDFSSSTLNGINAAELNGFTANDLLRVGEAEDDVRR